MITKICNITLQKSGFLCTKLKVELSWIEAGSKFGVDECFRFVVEDGIEFGPELV